MKKRIDFWVVDIGNSFVKIASVHDSKIGSVDRVPTKKITASWVKQWHRRSEKTGIVLASVVPSAARHFLKLGTDRVFPVHGNADFGLKIDYPRKDQLGADRLVGALAARNLYGAPVVVINFGTATTFDVVNRRGVYCGGVIAPGLNAMTDYLHERTALLPRISAAEPRTAIGRNTVEAMQIGAMTGYRGLVRHILQAIARQLKVRKIRVVATGGQAALIAPGLPEIGEVNPLLILEGLRMIGVYVYGKSD